MQAVLYCATAICCFAALQSALWASSSPRPKANVFFAALSLAVAVSFYYSFQWFFTQSLAVASGAVVHLDTATTVTTLLLIACVASFAGQSLKQPLLVLFLLLSVVMATAGELSDFGLRYQQIHAAETVSLFGQTLGYFQGEPSPLGWPLLAYDYLALGFIANVSLTLYRHERQWDALLLAVYAVVQAGVLAWGASAGTALLFSGLPVFALIALLSLRLGFERLNLDGQIAQERAQSEQERLERRKLEVSLQNIAFTDPLTALPNRVAFLQTADDLLQQQRANFLIYLLGINHFKDVNNAYGQSVGDELLRLVADRLRTDFCEAAVIARVGGDVFALLIDDGRLPGDTGEVPDIKVTGDEILAVLRVPYRVFDSNIKMDFGLGVVHSGELNASAGAHSLLIDAEYAMQRAKMGADGGTVIYNASIKEAQAREHSMLMSLRGAQARGELELRYQLKVDDRGDIVGMEALLRWYSREFGTVSPEEFIPLAERYGMISQLGEWVALSVCQQLSEWRALDLNPGRLSFNVSPFQLKHPGFSGLMQALLKRFRLDAEYLEVEVTESSLIEDFEHCKSELNALRGMGIHVSIDDFGTGYSSFSYLGQLPLDTLKIDKSFVDNILEPEGVEVVRSIIHVGRAFSCDIVAEGVETQEQLNALKALGCTKYQGYFFSHPLAARDVKKILTMADGFFAGRTPALAFPEDGFQQRSIKG